MKNVFGYLYDKSTERARCDGERFITARTDFEFNKELEAFSADAVDVVESTELPIWLQIVKGICMLAATFFIITVTKNIGDLTFKDMYQNSPIIFTGGASAVVIWLLLAAYEKIKFRKAVNRADFEWAEKSLNEFEARSEKELGVPSDYVKVDVLSFEYTVKNGREKIRDQIFYDYSNDEMKLFKQGDNLCLADLQFVYSIPIDECRKYILKKHMAHVDMWNKEEPFDKGEFKQYKIKAQDDDTISLKYYALQISDTFGEYELFFPEYELRHFKKIADVPDNIE